METTPRSEFKTSTKTRIRYALTSLWDATCPLTWETNASLADYSKMTVIFPEFVHQRIAMPHTWHAAEMFLYLKNHTRRLI